MSAYSEWILFVVNLAVNLFLFGLFIAGSVAVSFGLIKNAAPRLRYCIAVAAFLLAAFFPVIVTVNGSTGLETIFETKQNASANAFDDNFDNQYSSAQLESNSSAPILEAEKPSFNLLNNFTAFIADSFVGVAIFVLWVLVSAAFLSRDINAHRRLKKARQTWREAADAERAELALPGETPLYFGAEGPATIGLLRPVIVLPEHFPDNLSLAAKRFIVQHELAHVGWRDPLVNFLLRLMRAVFWISPALWMLERIAADEREAAADRAVIANSSANESDFEATALNYASTLVSVAKHFNSLTRRGSLKANTINLSGGSRLENRVRRLLTRSSEAVLLRLSFASMIFAGSLTGMLFMPIAFQAKQMGDGDEAAIINNQSPENLPDNDNLKNLPLPSRQDNLPQVVENKNKEGKSKIVALKQNKNQSQEFSNGTRETSEIPQLIFPLPKRTGTVNSNLTDGREELLKRLSREDAKNSELRRKVNKLNGNLESIDNSRKNLGSDILKMRQKAAAESDAKMMQTRTVVRTN